MELIRENVPYEFVYMSDDDYQEACAILGNYGMEMSDLKAVHKILVDIAEKSYSDGKPVNPNLCRQLAGDPGFLVWLPADKIGESGQKNLYNYLTALGFSMWTFREADSGDLMIGIVLNPDDVKHLEFGDTTRLKGAKARHLYHRSDIPGILELKVSDRDRQKWLERAKNFEKDKDAFLDRNMNPSAKGQGMSCNSAYESRIVPE